MAFACLLTTLPAHADEAFVSDSRLELHLKDGSQLKAVPLGAGLRANPRLADPFNVKWQSLREVDLKKGAHQAVLHLANEDRLTVELQDSSLRVGSLLGQLDVPMASIRRIEVISLKGNRRNVALGKPVHGRDGASHGKGLAKHVTDGDPLTHAKPPASNFDYRIDLQAGTEISYRIDEIVINWGHFGDHFKGIPAKNGKGWANAAWPGEYVTSYAVEYRRAGDDFQIWHTLHQHEGRPVNEDVPGVVIEKQEVDTDGYSSISVTRLTGLELRGVAELRIRAKGGHWIGLFELKALGTPE